MKKIIAAAMTFITLMSSVAYTGCSVSIKKLEPISLSSAETVVFGHYHDQDIEWIVLDTNENGDKFLLSKYVLDVMCYNDIEFDDKDYAHQSWETSTIRKWLNDDFYYSAFTYGERSGIRNNLLQNKINKKYNTDSGKDTKDKVFLLSIDEANDYFASEEDLKAKPMSGAAYPGLWTDDQGYCNWWLRSPGCEETRAANVRNFGYVYQRGDINSVFTYGVRPAIWVNFKNVTDQIDEPVVTVSETSSATTSSAETQYTYIDTSLVRITSSGTVIFGNYGSKSLEWIILEEKDGKALLISKDVIEARPYMSSESDVTWADCELREWLNNDFYDKAFFEGEKYLINTVTNENKGNSEYGIRGGRDTEDKVFVLSVDEANQYFASDTSRKAGPTDHVSYGGTAYVDSNGCCLWWLRTPGAQGCAAAYVDHLGRVKEGGIMNRYNYIGVRPVIWVTIE